MSLFLYMRIISLSFLLLFNLSTHVMSCPSSGDGDCVPSTDSYNQGTNQNPNQSDKETLSLNTSKNYNKEESDGGLPDNYIAKSTSYLKEINIEKWRIANYEHPFVLGIGDGSLKLNKFQYYLKQDYVFLI